MNNGLYGHPGVFRDLEAGCARELVRLALDEAVEGEGRVQVTHGPLGAWRSAGALVCSTAFVAGLATTGGRRDRNLRTANPESHAAPVLLAHRLQLAHGLLDRFQQVIAHVLEHKLVRREQSQPAFGLFGMKRPQPGVELLFADLPLQAIQTGCPQGIG